MVFDARLFKKILGITEAVILVLLIGALLQNEDKKISLSSSEIRDASDEFDLNINSETFNFTDNEIIVAPHDSENILYKVVKVIDGDTIAVDAGGKKETVRLIGIDAPEIGAKKECFSKEAEESVKNILSDASIELEEDESQNDRDKYGRFLGYIILKDGSNFNKTLIREGLAKEYTYKTPYKYQKEFKNAETEARKAKKGLWNACYDNNNNHNSGGDEDRNSNNSLSSAPILGTGDCYCESNKYNCSDFKTHLEAQKVFECCIVKVGKDIHKMDGNSDSQVCENLP